MRIYNKILDYIILIIFVLTLIHTQAVLAQFDTESKNRSIYNFNSQSASRSFVPINDALHSANEYITPMLDSGMPMRMVLAIDKYTKIKNKNGWTKVSYGHPIKPGRWDSRIPELRKRLIEEGYIKPYEMIDSKKYDNTLVEAIKRFQYNRAIKADGIVDSKTIEQLNIPPQHIIDKLRVNTIRAQEYSKNLTQDYVIVNIPSQTLEAVEGEKVYSRHNVITGSVERPTPMMSSVITQVNFNPYWHIPKSIIEKDILPNVRRNPSLLKRHNIRVFEHYNGSEIDTEFINWNLVSPDQYHFRQDPGRKNAMDSVRINFSNRYSVYLHDTPDKLLFSQAGRYISSGCIRVDQIHILTEWLLRDNAGWTKEHIKAIVDSVERFDTDMRREVSIRIIYMTAWADDEGIVSLRHDPYTLDGTDFVFGQPAPIESEIIKETKKNNQIVILGGNPIEKKQVLEELENISEQIEDKVTNEEDLMSLSTSFSDTVSRFMQ